MPSILETGQSERKQDLAADFSLQKACISRHEGPIGLRSIYLRMHAFPRPTRLALELL
jgi:hypothetical protein